MKKTEEKEKDLFEEEEVMKEQFEQNGEKKQGDELGEREEGDELEEEEKEAKE